MAINLDIEMTGQEELIKKLSDPAVIAGPLKELLEEASSIGRKTVVEGIDGGTGVAVSSIGIEVQPLSARVYTAIAEPRALSIEKGRPPGDTRWTSDGHIQKWAESVGVSEPLFVLTRGIRQRGVKGRFFMAAARQKVESELPRLLNNMARIIEEKFNK